MAQLCGWPYTDHPVIHGRGQQGALSRRRTERRVGARLFGRWRGLSAVPVWPIGWSLVLYIYTSPSFLGRMSVSAAMRYVGIIESPAGRGLACYEDSPADYDA